MEHREIRIEANRKRLESQIRQALLPFQKAEHSHEDYAKWLSEKYREDHLGKEGVITTVTRVLQSVKTRKFYVEVEFNVREEGGDSKSVNVSKGT